MAEKSYEDKTEKATPKRRKESRSFSLPIGSEVHVQDYVVFGQDMIILFVLTLAPLFAAIVIAAVLSNIMQVGFLLSAESIKPKFSKLNPLKGFERLFSKQSIMELVKSLLKLAIVGGVGYFTIKGEIKNLLFLGDMELHSIITYTFATIFKLFITCTIAMIFVVAIDYAFQKWDFEKRLRMSKNEIKDEFKKTEGDPLIKSRIRSIQMQMAKKRMMHDVPDADVVITNPTHFAVAIKYDGLTMGAPKLLAKGAGGIAKRIKELAAQHDIPIVENKELARSLYSLVEVGQEVPGVLYQSIAEVLAYIYRIKNNRKG